VKNVIDIFYKNAWWIFLITAFLIATSITFSSNFRNSISFPFDENEFKTVVSTYSVPLTVIGLLIPVYGVIISLRRLYQTDEALKVQHENIYMNNYYRHLDEFIKLFTTIKDLLEKKLLSPEINEINTHDFNEMFFRTLYQHWFGKRFHSDHKILPDILTNLRTLIETSEKLLTIEGPTASDTEFQEMEDELYVCLENLGLTPILRDFSTRTNLIITIFITKHIFDFSDQDKSEVVALEQKIRDLL